MGTTRQLQQQEPIHIDPSDSTSDDGNNNIIELEHVETTSQATSQASADSSGLKMHQGVKDSASLYYGPNDPSSRPATAPNEATHNVDLQKEKTVNGNGETCN